ncbi:DUF4203 domain-containing protein [Patescibacteria group bacterium]
MIETLLFVLLIVILGLAFTFMGYPLFRTLLPIWAFVMGLIFGVQALDALAGGGLISVSLGLIMGFFIGLLFAAIAYWVYAFAIVIFGISVGYVLGQGLMLLIGFDYGFVTLLFGLLGAVLMAMLFVKGRFPRFFIIIATASSGAMAVMTGIFVLFGRLPTASVSVYLSRYVVYGSWFWLIVWAILAGLGMAVQYTSVKEAEELQEAFLIEEYTAESEKLSKGKK